MKLRRTVSLTTLISFVLLLSTSIILYVTPQGKIAFWANWKLLGLDKEQWGAMHTNLGILFIAAGVLHTVLNWKPIVVYLKKAQRIRIFTGDFNIALGISLVVVLFTLFELPPISGVQGFNERLKEAAAEKYGEPPYGHAEASTLKSFCKRTGLELDNAIMQLNEGGLQSVSAEATLAEIAAANGKTPQQVYNLTKPGSATQSAGMPAHPTPGFGRKTLSEVCETYGLAPSATISGLRSVGIKASADEKVKEIAEANDTEPAAIYEAILELQ